MKLQTQIPLQPQQHNQIDYNSKVVLLGSCFSEHIGDKFNYFKFLAHVNPFGILFHPLAIENLVTRAINQDDYTEQDLHFHNEQWCCLDSHSRLNNTSKKTLLHNLNVQIDNTHAYLKSATHIIITFGTSWVYRHTASDAIVANCHKLPQNQFTKEILSIHEITEAVEAVISSVKAINPAVSFLFTVSPVRHLKDGFIENTQSKSHLIAAIHQVIDSGKQLYYFPSYEIMMDELRDYRFYGADMLHPSALAVDYIWDKFKTVWFTHETRSTAEVVDRIQKDLAHKPFNAQSEAHQKFLTQLQTKMATIQKTYPHILF